MRWQLTTHLYVLTLMKRRSVQTNSPVYLMPVVPPGWRRIAMRDCRRKRQEIPRFRKRDEKVAKSIVLQVLVHNGAGGVGSILLQLLYAWQTKQVVATASRRESLALIDDFGKRFETFF